VWRVRAVRQARGCAGGQHSATFILLARIQNSETQDFLLELENLQKQKL
jgi:hypothetical protein